MSITEKEIQIIAEINTKRELGKKKWMYLLFDIVQDKRTRGIPFDDISEWLSKNGLHIKSSSLRKMIWEYKKKFSNFENNPQKSNTITSKVNNEVSKPSTILFLDKGNVSTDSINYSEELRKRERELKIQNAGFDQFENL